MRKDVYNQSSRTKLLGAIIEMINSNNTYSIGCLNTKELRNIFKIQTLL